MPKIVPLRETTRLLCFTRMEKYYKLRTNWYTIGFRTQNLSQYFRPKIYTVVTETYSQAKHETRKIVLLTVL